MTTHAALLAWPLVVVVLFRRVPLPAAIVWSVVGGYLLLPPRFFYDLPALPRIDKESLPAAMAMLMVLIAAADPRTRRALRAAPASGAATGAATGGPSGGAKEATRRADPTIDALRAAAARRRHPLIVVALAGALLYGIGTVATNSDPISEGVVFLPGLRPYDAASMILSSATMLLPFVLARRYLATEAAVATILRVLVLAGLGYALLALVEVRLSPQLNRWVYGYFPHSFAQHMRGGGFRPMVFLEHGLRVGIVLIVACLSAAALWRVARDAAAARPARRTGGTGGTGGPGGPGGRARLEERAEEREAREERRGVRSGGRPAGRAGPRSGAAWAAAWPARNWLLAVAGLVVVTVLSRVLGATLILFVLLPVMLFAGTRGRVAVAAATAVLVIVYPILRGADVVPTDAVTRLAGAISTERAQSFEFRLRNEDILLEHARERPVFGWGSFNRNRVFDPYNGRDISVTDGTWVIVIGIGGWVSYLSIFGLLCGPMLLLWRRRARVDPATAGLAVVLAANLVDLIPNSSLTAVTWLLAGSLAGRIEAMDAQAILERGPQRGPKRDPQRDPRPDGAGGRMPPRAGGGASPAPHPAPHPARGPAHGHARGRIPERSHERSRERFRERAPGRDGTP